MKKYINYSMGYFWICIYFLSISTLLADNDPISSANIAITHNNMNDAVKILDKYIKSEGIKSISAHNNLAVIYLKRADIGLARYHFEKALALDVNNKEIKRNISILTSKFKNNIIDIDTFGPFSTFLTFLSKTNPLILIALSIILLLCFLLLQYFQEVKDQIPLNTFWIKNVVLGLFILVVSFGILQYYFFANSSQNAVVVSKNTEMKLTPNSNSETLLPLEAGYKANIIEIKENWCKIILANRDRGWVNTNNLILLD